MIANIGPTKLKQHFVGFFHLFYNGNLQNCTLKLHNHNQTHNDRDHDFMQKLIIDIEGKKERKYQNYQKQNKNRKNLKKLKKPLTIQYK